jgi:endo-1,4-beta-xylanase
LAFNEYNILNNNSGANDRHRLAAAQLVEQLIKSGAPVNSLGMQGHMSVPLTHGDKLLSILDEWARFKLPVEITEYDLPVADDTIHAQYLREFLTAVFSHPAVEGFTMWGFWAGTQWFGDEGRSMFRQDWTARPSVDVYKNLVFRKWWTKATSKTDHDGSAKFRVFLGEHKVTVTKDKRSVSTNVFVEDDQLKTITLILPEPPPSTKNSSSTRPSQ